LTYPNVWYYLFITFIDLFSSKIAVSKTIVLLP